MTSSVLVARQHGPVTATSPRSSSSLSTPTSARAVPRPGPARSASALCTWIDRTRTSRSSGSNRTLSPALTVPLHVEPVTTVPAPGSAKTRSIGSRKTSSAGRSPTAPTTANHPFFELLKPLCLHPPPRDRLRPAPAAPRDPLAHFGANEAEPVVVYE